MHVLKQELVFVNQIIRGVRLALILCGALVCHRFHHVLCVDIAEQIMRRHSDDQLAHAGGCGFHVFQHGSSGLFPFFYVHNYLCLMFLNLQVRREGPKPGGTKRTHLFVESQSAQEAPTRGPAGIEISHIQSQ